MTPFLQNYVQFPASRPALSGAGRDHGTILRNNTATGHPVSLP